MSLHQAVEETFERIQGQFNADVQLSRADVNRIVTHAVQSFDLSVDTSSFLEGKVNEYVTNFKLPRKKGGCNCGGRKK